MAITQDQKRLLEAEEAVFFLGDGKGGVEWGGCFQGSSSFVGCVV